MATPIFNTSDNCLIPVPFPEIIFLSVPNRSLSGAEGNPLGDGIFLSRVHIPLKSAPRGGSDRQGIICWKADKSKPTSGMEQGFLRRSLCWRPWEGRDLDDRRTANGSGIDLWWVMNGERVPR
jgi:hypothetical protein